MRIDAESAGPGAAKSYFLLNGCHGVESTAELFGVGTSERFEDDPDAAFIVHAGRRNSAVEQLAIAQFDRGGIADADSPFGFFPIGRADVDPEFLEFDDSLSFFLFEQMDRLASDHPGEWAVFGPHRDALPDEDLRVPAADRSGIKIAIVVDVLDDHADLVAVTGHHDLDRRVGVFDCHDIAVDVGADLVGKRFGILADLFLDAGFVS